MHVPIDENLVAEGRALAQAIVGDMLTHIRARSTVSIERSALRLLGVDGVDAEGVPRPNRVVDAVALAGRLEVGVCTWIGSAAVAWGLPADQAAERLMSPGVDWAALEAAPRPEVETWCAAACATALEGIATRRRERDQLQAKLGMGRKPWKYLIVATGNIHEDIPQGVAAARQGADVIAVIRHTGQSLIDFVPHGATTDGSGGTYATGENFRLMREALDKVGEELGRYIQLTNYASGLCMPEIAVLAAQNRLDMLLNDALYGILFRDINLHRTLIDQHFSRMVNAHAGILINTGEDNYLTTADAIEKGHTVLTSQLINERFALEAGLPKRLMGLGHAFEIDPTRPDGYLDEIAMAQLVRQVFPEHPLKYMPPTKHITGNIFQSFAHQTLYNLVAVLTKQDILLLGILTEAIHTPFVSDRYLALQNAQYVFNFGGGLGAEISLDSTGAIARRASQVLEEAVELLRHIASVGLVAAIGEGCFGDVKRLPTGGKGLTGVFEKAPRYLNPFWDALERQSQQQRSPDVQSVGGLHVHP